MTIILPPFGPAFKGDPCSNAPTFSSHTNDTLTNPSCPSTSWVSRSIIVLVGSLNNLEIEREVATDSAGTSWVFWKRSQVVIEQYDHTTPMVIGEGDGDPITQYFKSRARITDPGNGNNPCGDGSWTTNASQLIKDGLTCV
jgi:hypothetical protein